MDGNLEIHVNGLRFRPDGPSSKIGKLNSIPDLSKLTLRPPFQQHKAPILSAKRKGAYRSHSRSPQSAHHAWQEEDFRELVEYIMCHS
jgi:hypothetical protein